MLLSHHIKKEIMKIEIVLVEDNWLIMWFNWNDHKQDESGFQFKGLDIILPMMSL